MHLNGTAALSRHQAGPVSPVISQEDGWLGEDGHDQPLTLQLRLPVSAEELAAALCDDFLSPADLAADVNVWGFAAVAIAQDGLTAIQRRANEIVVAEAGGTLANPAWLAFCRRRVAEVTGTAVAASRPTATTAPAGAPPPGSPPARHSQTQTSRPEPGTHAGCLAYVRALTETASPCRAGN